MADHTIGLANEDAHHIRGQDNNGLVTMKGCDGYQRMTGLEAFGVFSGVVGTIGFILDRIEAAQTTAQLNQIQDQIQKLDTKMDALTRSVSDLKLGQEYSQLVFLYGRDEQRLRNMIKTLANLQISSGKYILPGHRIQHWADMVLSYGSDGVHESRRIGAKTYVADLATWQKTENRLSATLTATTHAVLVMTGAATLQITAK
ncbi:hypothetical protein Bbelb_117980, partial [Branchiostoma belcheri]